MSVNLIYKHQQKTYELMKEELSKGKRVAYVFPTGCGKSFPVLKYIEENPNKRILLVSSGLETIHQFQTYIQQYILGSKDKLTKRQFPNFRAITYQKVTLSTSICDLHPDVIILDEIHRMGAEEWGPAIDKLLSTFPDAEVVGMSATPKRTDKRNMAYEKFDSVVYEMSLTEALSGEKENEVVLNGARYVRDLSQLRKLLPRYRQQIEKIGDKQEKEELLAALKRLEEIAENAPTTQDIMVDAMQKKNGKYLVFCSNREEMFKKMEMAQEIFGKVNSNIQIDYVITRYNGTGKSKAENRRTIEEFEKREESDALNLFFCVDMLNEGIHLKGISGEVMFAPTDSAIVFKQRIGRVLTSEEQQEQTVIVDAANNWIRQAGAFKELQQAALRGTKISGKKGIVIEEGKGRGATKKTEKLYNLFAFNPEDIEVLNILESIQERFWYNNQNIYEQLIEWLETHDGKMPRKSIKKGNKSFTIKEMTPDEQYEYNLAYRWGRTPECKAFMACSGISIENLPLEYEPYKEKIVILRSYGLTVKKRNEKTTYEELIEWLEQHNGKMPRKPIKRDGKILKVSEMTEEEKFEKRLSANWKNATEYKVLQACKRN